MARRKRQPIKRRHVVRAARSIGVDKLLAMDKKDAAVLVAATALKAKGIGPEDPSIDWDGLIAFIEKILPLILRLIDLFT